MLGRQTLLIVGAGASKEAGLPEGWQLATKIANTLACTKNPGGPRWADANFYSYVELHSHVEKEPLAGYIEAAERICQGVQSVNSIDNYLHFHQNDHYINRLGKAAIVYAIINSERESKFFWVNRDSQNELPFNRIENTWYFELSKILFDGMTDVGLDSIFDGLSIISFNYDRCIEYYMAHEISKVSGRSFDDALQIVSKLPIYRPYGSVGELPSSINKSGVGFGAKLNGADYNSTSIFKLAKQIKTYTEQIQDVGELEAMHREIKFADLIIFLGFGFHPQNMKMLDATSVNSSMTPVTIFATALTESSPNMRKIQDSIENITHRPRTVDILGSTCQSLLRDYRRYLIAA